MHVYEQGCIFFVIEVFSWWRLHTCINIDKVGTVTVSPGLFFRLRFLLFSLYIFFFHIFFKVDWSLYSVTWGQQGLRVILLSTCHIELLSKHGLIIKFPFFFLYFLSTTDVILFSIIILYMYSIVVLDYWGVLQISRDRVGLVWTKHSVHFLMPVARLDSEM